MDVARAHRSRGRKRDVTLPFEETYPWEDERGTAAERTKAVNLEAKRVYAEQEKLLPTVAQDKPLDPIATEHLQDVGRRVLILRDATKQSRKTKEGSKSPTQQSPKRVIPSRFPEITADLKEEDNGEADRVEEDEDPAVMEGRIATMLMDLEWDTRAWNTTKVHTAVDTLYEEIENSNDESRRKLATTMLVRLLETHEDAVDYVERTLPSLTNKAFRTLSKLTDNTKIFRVVLLVSVLAEWFTSALSNQSAATKSIACLQRETELCARILQHHWRGVLFERTANQRDYDPIVRTRLRSMHMIKFVELRHQFKVFREAIGPGGIPSSIKEAYVTILLHLVKPPREPGSVSDKMRNTVLADQRRILGSGVLLYLASMITQHQRREVIELVKRIVLEITEGHGDEQIVEILQCNIVERVKLDLRRIMQEDSFSDTTITTTDTLTSSLNLLSAIALKVHLTTQRLGQAITTSSTPTGPLPRSPSRYKTPVTASDRLTAAGIEERGFLLRKLKASVQQFLLIPDVFDALFEVLDFCQHRGAVLQSQVLRILSLLSRSLGFSQLLAALTRDGGRWLAKVLRCMNDSNLIVEQAAVTLFYDISSLSDGRLGLTAAGAVEIFIRWCRPSFEASESSMAFVMGLIGCALLARQTDQVKPATSLLAALTTIEDRLDALYTILLDLVLQDELSPHASEKTAVYFLSVNALPTLVPFLAQVTPSCMESPLQNSRQRSISCILLGRLFKVSHVARACFSEDVVNHLALSIQCNRLDEIEGLLARISSEERFVHELGSKEACKALGRLARCPSNLVNSRLRSSITSPQVPEWPQAMICDVIIRMHVLEDLIALIRSPSDAAEFAEIELNKVIAAVELAGYIRPVPYGESVREVFLKTHDSHPHGKYAQEKLLQLVALIAPAILHILREKSVDGNLVTACCMALSRLACTNAACSLLLTQGCLQTALVHLPEILLSTQGEKSPQKRQSVEFDSSVDDHGLLDVPAALYTLFGKLCAVADGRTGMMHAQVLPRLLKRLQLRHPTSRAIDDECKSEIAVVISRLAMVNAVEGNTSELFLHFRVLELLAKILQQHSDLVRSLATEGAATRKKTDVKKWRLLDHTVSAIAALSQDVLVCVPRVVALGIVELLFPFLVRFPRGENANPHLSSLQYSTVTIIRSIASYPFGEYHSYVTNVKGVVLGSTLDTKKAEGKAGKSATTASVMVMDRVKQIAFDFAMELQNKSMATRDKKTVGELARETLAFINEHQQRQQRHRLSNGSSSGGGLGIDGSSDEQPRRSIIASPIRTRASPASLCSTSFPTLPQSPVDRPDAAAGARSSFAAKNSLEMTSPTAVESPIAAAPSILVLDGGSKSPVNLNGVNIASTRPSGNNKPLPSSESPQQRHHYIFTRPKSKSKRRDQDPAHGLMLDPLFDSRPRNPRRSLSCNTNLVADEQLPNDADAIDRSFSFSQETDLFGHCVGVKARRSKRGDRYFPSLGRIVTVDPLPPDAYKRPSGHPAPKT